MMNQEEHPTDKAATRVSVTIPAGDYEAIQQIAKSKSVSCAWVVRDAVKLYVRKDIPLLANLIENQ